MTELRAFVGHSFTEDDDQIVRVFLDYFNVLQAGPLSFRWEHALKAEPRDLADKVLDKIKDKDIFIGICTRKEKVLTKDARSFLGLRFGEPKYDWKTSDWVIQEIGLAIGRGLRLVLLIEEGVRGPGGLQGDINYIPFKRNSPHQSFAQIYEMIGSLTPRKSTAVAVVEIETEAKKLRLIVRRRTSSFRSPIG